jgi:hypothetical protein
MSHIISIFIPGNIQPFERGQRFSDPLQEALKQKDLGEVVEEGTHLERLGERQVIKGGQIEIEVKSVRGSLPLIRRTLAQAGAPAETTITVAGKGGPQVFKLAELPRKR